MEGLCCGMNILGCKLLRMRRWKVRRQIGDGETAQLASAQLIQSGARKSAEQANLLPGFTSAKFSAEISPQTLVIEGINAAIGIQLDRRGLALRRADRFTQA